LPTRLVAGLLYLKHAYAREDGGRLTEAQLPHCCRTGYYRVQ